MINLWSMTFFVQANKRARESITYCLLAYFIKQLGETLFCCSVCHAKLHLQLIVDDWETILPFFSKCTSDFVVELQINHISC